MYADTTYKIVVSANGERLRTLRVTDTAVKNCMRRTGRSFETSLAGMIRPQFRQGEGKKPDSPAFYDKVYSPRMLRECVENGVSKLNEIEYILTSGHAESDEDMKYRAFQNTSR